MIVGCWRGLAFDDDDDDDDEMTCSEIFAVITSVRSFRSFKLSLAIVGILEAMR